MIARARVIKAAFPKDAPTQTGPSLARRVPRETMSAREEAARIVTEANAAAAAIVAEARATAANAVAAAARDAREHTIAQAAAELVAVRTSEERRRERELDRTVEVAMLLAERIVGEGLRLEPERIAAIANDALRETRGARQVRIEASADDAPVLARLLAEANAAAEVIANADLTRGSVVVHTELGQIDARLEPQLARLADALREALRGAS